MPFSLSELYASIGPAGVALLLVACAGIYLALKNYFYLFFVRRGFRRVFLKTEHAEIIQKCMEYHGDNPLACIVCDIVNTYSGKPENIKDEVSYLFHRNFAQVIREICYLRLISVMAPLLGLLGTVLGMTAVFKTIARNAVPDASMLAAGISEALVTTIMGLCVAIPALMLYYFLKLRLKGFQIEIIEYSCRALRRNGIKNINGVEHA